MASLLEVDQLNVTFRTDRGKVTPVDGISFSVDTGQTLCIIGESGSGKSVASLSLMRLLGSNGRIEQGDVRLSGTNLAELSEAELRRMRGKDVSMIFQDPMTALNPVFTIGHQLKEAILLHTELKGKAAAAYAVDMLRKVGIARPESVMSEYPHALSGGMRQRVVIAMAIACGPKLLIADEPTTALDVTIQAQILNLLKQLREQSQTGIVLITHDLSIVAEMADNVLVMYAGQIVEETDVFTLFAEPLHPYTQGLMSSIPSLDDSDDRRLVPIPGTVPNLQSMPEGCRFHPRCERAQDRCRQDQPELKRVKEGHRVRCWITQEEAVDTR